MKEVETPSDKEIKMWITDPNHQPEEEGFYWVQMKGWGQPTIKRRYYTPLMSEDKRWAWELHHPDFCPEAWWSEKLEAPKISAER